MLLKISGGAMRLVSTLRLSTIALLKRAAACREGLAATEFALLSPILVIMFFGVLEASDAMTINRRVALASNTLADLVAQSEEVTGTDIDNLIEGVLEILEPNDTSVVSIKITSVIADADGDPVVHWSRDQSGAEPYGEGTDFTKLTDPDVLSTSGSLIVVEMSYPYTPQITHRVLGGPITFTRETIRWPRLAPRVQMCDSPGVNCTT
ncbi:MAG TPA: pilus assembly protein [Parvularculaceae bacterium]|nr:pilus assembly protein [Parvularculaceae bacterium]